MPAEHQCWFMHADKDGICIGGGEDQKHAIVIDAQLKNGISATSQTFENDPLCSTSNFVVSTVEVWGFREHH